MTSQVTGPRKIKICDFLPRNGAWLEVGHLSGGFPDKRLLSLSVKKRSHLMNVSISQPQNHGNHCMCATKGMSMFPPGKSLVLLELKVHIICDI